MNTNSSNFSSVSNSSASNSIEGWPEPFMFPYLTSSSECFIKYFVIGNQIETVCNGCNKSLHKNLYFLHPEDKVHYLVVYDCGTSCKGISIPIDKNIPYIKRKMARKIFDDQIYPVFKKIWRDKENQLIIQNKKEIEKIPDIYNPSNSSNSEIIYPSKMCCVFQ